MRIGLGSFAYGAAVWLQSDHLAGGSIIANMCYLWSYSFPFVAGELVPKVCLVTEVTKIAVSHRYFFYKYLS